MRPVILLSKLLFNIVLQFLDREIHLEKELEETNRKGTRQLILFCG
jgi:hypothetical protein